MTALHVCGAMAMVGLCPIPSITFKYSLSLSLSLRILVCRLASVGGHNTFYAYFIIDIIATRLLAICDESVRARVC